MAAVVLVLERSDAVRQALRAVLDRLGYRVLQGRCLADLDGTAAPPADVIIAGEVTDETDACVSVVRDLRKRGCYSPVILFPAAVTENVARAALRLGVVDLVRKPDYHAVAAAVGNCVEHTCAPPLAGVASCMVGSSASLSRARDYLAKLAASECNVLIMGETGTGKELAAHAIHANSSRMNAAFVAVNCAAIPDSLFESELFGYERGAFTGAHARHDGKLAQAHGGTIFLDEIGEMSAYAQAKLLRAIEDKLVTRLGGRGHVPIDVRVITATNQPLDRLVTESRFRRDLYFRLAVTRVNLPPLRERLEDVSELAAHFIRDLNRRLGRCITGVTPEALAALQRHLWPGNVRELRNLLEAVAVEKYRGEVAVRDLPWWFLETHSTQAEPDERARILSALEQTRWNKSEAAAHLKWSRMTLYRKMVRYCIQDTPRRPPQRAQSRPAHVDAACARVAGA